MDAMESALVFAQAWRREARGAGCTKTMSSWRGWIAGRYANGMG
jgi:hypothetical protein